MNFGNIQEKCPVCGSEVRWWNKVGEFNIKRCTLCGLGITDNPKYQKSGYHRDETYIKSKDRFLNIFQRRVNLINHYYQNGKVLEIGSSTGLMLSILKDRGWDVYGLEISRGSADYAKEHGIPTQEVPFEKAKLPPVNFDVVIINHTLEHLKDPGSVLAKIYSLLRPGGILLLDVPNFGSFSAKILRGRWPYLLPEEHLWHFTFSSMTKLLKKNGFKILHRSSPSGVWDYANPCLEIWQSFKGLKKRFIGNVLTVLPTALASYFRWGTTLTIIAKKV